MSVSDRYTAADVDAIEAAEGRRCEIVDGELSMSGSPSWQRQQAGGRRYG